MAIAGVTSSNQSHFNTTIFHFSLMANKEDVINESDCKDSLLEVLQLDYNRYSGRNDVLSSLFEHKEVFLVDCVRAIPKQ